GTSISSGRTLTRSTGITVSAPAGTTPPVEISIASPVASVRASGRPAATLPTILRTPGTSTALTAYPSMDELGNGGRSTCEQTCSARILPAARSSGTRSGGSGSERARTGARASATVRSAFTIARYTRRTGYPRGVISVVIPVHDEERSVALLYDELAATFAGEGRDWEALFVDDGSSDGTFGALARLHDAHDNVRVVRLRRNFGKATALDAGFAEAAGEIVVTIDGDLQDDPAEIPRLLAKLDEGYDLVSGWKTKRRDPLTRRIPSKIFNAVAGKVSGVRLHDMNCGLKAYRAEVVDGMQLYGELHRYIPVLAHYRGYRVT